MEKVVVPNAAVWSALMSVCARAGRSREALDALALMRARGYTLEPYTLASALTACRESVGGSGGSADYVGGGGGGGGGGVSASLKQSTEAREALDVFESAPVSASGTTAVRNAAIALYAAVGLTDRAFALYEEMRIAASEEEKEDYDPDRPTDGCHKKKDEPRVAATMISTNHDRNRTQRAPDTITYNTLIAACVASNQPHRARQLHRDMVAADVPRSTRTYVSLMAAAVRAAPEGEGAAAAAAAEVFAAAEADATTGPANAFTYTALIDAQAKGGAPEAEPITYSHRRTCI